MQLHFTTPIFGSWWHERHAHLPTHLPRLLLASRFQPKFVRRCPVTQTISAKLTLLDWEQLPTTVSNKRTGWRTIPLAAYIGAYLIKLDQDLPTFGKLRCYLRDHPALIWALGFPLVPDVKATYRFDIEASLPTQRHLSRKLSEIPNEIIQNLLDGQVSWLKDLLGEPFGRTVSLDTKHILAWVKENNPKTFIKEGRLDKTKQPAGDPDCKLGCKRRRNQLTPTKEGKPVNEMVSVGEYYWGYASGAVVTKISVLGEFVLAETTQTFDRGDSTYFFPLMDQVERRLGFRPTFGAFDAAFDAFYVYDYFHRAGEEGFAAVPLRQMKPGGRSFDKDGLPICEAGLAMPLKSSFVNRTSLVQHRRGRYVCPLLYPESTASCCPIEHPKWENGGCKLVMATSAGARIRYQLDRESDEYKSVYNQRTAVERIFSQAVNLGIERPKLRNRMAIANINSLTYILINLRAMLRVDHLLSER